jgi:RNA polymerase sigma-70 factor (ECF subfamily)
VKERLSALQLSQADELVVISLACTKDPEAFAEMVRRYHSRVRSLMHRLSNKPDLAEDLAQEVFLKVWKSIHQLKAPGAFYGWLRKITVSIWVENVRRNKLDFFEETEFISRRQRL